MSTNNMKLFMAVSTLQGSSKQDTYLVSAETIDYAKVQVMKNLRAGVGVGVSKNMFTLHVTNNPPVRPLMATTASGAIDESLVLLGWQVFPATEDYCNKCIKVI
jgi:hypothetical protein